MPEPDYWLHYLEWVSFCHGIFCLILGGYCQIVDGFTFNRKTTNAEFICIINSIAYFVYDTIAEYRYGTLDAGITAHHIASIGLTLSILLNAYGGAAIVAGLLYAETSNPFFILRGAWRRKGLENTITYLIFLWTYAGLYILSRGLVYIYITYYITFALNIPFYVKIAFLPNLFLSHAWLILILSMIWKSIPNWYSNPKEVENSEWWLNGRAFFQKYTKDAPWVYINTGIIIIYSTVIPISLAYYAHYIDRSWGVE